MAAALRSFYFCIVFSAYCFSLALAEDDSLFIYNGFAGAELRLFGAFVHDNGLLHLTNTSLLNIGRAFCRFPIKFNTSSSQSLYISTNFVFAMVPGLDHFGGNGIAFVISPSMKFRGADSGSYLRLFNISNNGQSTNHILAVELDTVQNPVFQDINGNHVGIDVNNLISNNSAPAAYFSDEITSMGRLRHRNLVQLHGYCRRKGELLLVYDYMPNESLGTILYSNEKPKRNWFQLLKIRLFTSTKNENNLFCIEI